MRSDAEMKLVREEWLADLDQPATVKNTQSSQKHGFQPSKSTLAKSGGAEKYLLNIRLDIEEPKNPKQVLMDRGELPKKAKMLLDIRCLIPHEPLISGT